MCLLEYPMKTLQESKTVYPSKLELLCSMQQQSDGQKKLIVLMEKLERLMEERLVELDEIGEQIGARFK